MRTLTLLACLPAILSAQDPREIVRRSVEWDRKNLEISRNYTFLQRQEMRQTDGSGNVKKVETATYDVTLLEGSPYRRLVARDDKPLPAREQQKEEEKLQKSIEDRRKETKEQHERRIADWNRKQEKQREPLKELPDAFDFRLAGEEKLNGADTWVIDATPKPGYKPKLPNLNYVSKVKARFWIEKSGYEWVKVDMETVDTVSVGLFLFRLAKGTHITMEQARINNEVWLPKQWSIKGSGRILLVKALRGEFNFTFSDYKKFQAESRIVSVEEKGR